MQKVLVTEEINQAGIDVLAMRDYQVDVKLGLTTEELIACIGDYDGLIVRSHTQVTRDVVEAGKDRLKVIGRAGVSITNIDLDAATEHGIIVCNAPNSNIISTAEYALALLLSAARMIPLANESMHEGRWDNRAFKGRELFEKTLAIVGLGRVGSLVAQRAAALGMNLIGYDPYCSADRANSLGVELVEHLDDMLPLADFITIHAPKTNETIGMFGPEQFACMKDGVVIVNVSSGEIFNEKAMADFIAADKIQAIGFDVFADEPCEDSPLHEFSQAILTPHIGANTIEAQRRAGAQIATYVAQALAGSIVPTAVNLSHVPPEIMDKFGPYLTAAEMIGRIILQIEGDIPHEITLTAAGTLSSANTAMLLASTLKGLMSYKSIGAVSADNAIEVASRHGISANLASLVNASGYDSSLMLQTPQSSIACTLYGTERPARIIELFGYSFDIEPSAQSLVIRYVDAPGRIGVIGTILGEANVNITTMQIGTKENSESVIVFLNIEGEISEDVIEKIREAIPELQDLWRLSL